MDQNSAGMFSGVFMICALAIVAILIASMWKIFTKAGQPGWAAIVPIYNIVVLLNIVGKPVWWLILFLIPFVGFVMSFIVMIALAQCFGKGAGFGVGLVFLGIIFFPILGFGDARYQGPLHGAPVPA